MSTQPPPTYCKRNRPLPYYHPNCRSPRHWKFYQDHRTTRLPEKHNEISKTKEVIFCWIRGHVNITGNETADRKAKESLKLNTSMFEMPSNNFKPFINNYVLSQWQSSLDTAVFNKLHAIEPNIGNDSSAIRNLRREEVVIARLRIGQT